MRSYDTCGRPGGIEVGTTSNPDVGNEIAYSYDSTGRLNNVTDPQDTWTYSFVANSNLLAQTASTVTTVTTVLYSIENKVGTTTVSEYAYAVSRNDWEELRPTDVRQPEGCRRWASLASTFRINQRTNRTQSGSAFATSSDAFSYNTRGEVIGSVNDQISAREFDYSYDAIGNRQLSSKAGLETTYSVNMLNQYTAITLDGGTPSTPSFDADGNETLDGKGNQLVWDRENRLIEWNPVSPASGDKRIVNTYDGQSRRVRKQSYTWSGSAWTLNTDQVFLYDAWNPVAVYLVGTSTFAWESSLTWGRDLSGSMQGAGGVGGLLSTFNGGTDARMFYDGNGNVGQVINGANDQTIAIYEYDAIGDLVTSSGSFADVNPFKFSTKYQDAESGWYYYGYRFYNPEMGRWINRDPIGESGGINLFGIGNNNFIVYFDFLGLTDQSPSGTVEAATMAALNEIWQKSKDIDQELCGWILIINNPPGCFDYTKAVNELEKHPTAIAEMKNARDNHGWSEAKINATIIDAKKKFCTAGEKPENASAFYHTHGNGDSDSEQFSFADLAYALEIELAVFLATPEGAFGKAIPMEDGKKVVETFYDPGDKKWKPTAPDNPKFPEEGRAIPNPIVFPL